MHEGTLIKDHLRYMKVITDKLAAINEAISEEDQVVTLLGSVPETYNAVVTALETKKGLVPPSLSDKHCLARNLSFTMLSSWYC